MTITSLSDTLDELALLAASANISSYKSLNYTADCSKDDPNSHNTKNCVMSSITCDNMP